jgi:two-component system, sensor histidine kinase and response regulator
LPALAGKAYIEGVNPETVRRLLQRGRKPETPAPLVANEPLRLTALRRYDVLDSLPEPVFDDLARLAAHICDMPFAGITFVDEKRLWFKACVGFAATEMPREVSPCSETILGEELVIVDDARRDPRFAKSPFVAGEPHIRFYAGAPLCTTDKHNIGTLWVGDARKRRISRQCREGLHILAHQVVAQLDLRRHLVELERSLFDHRRTQHALKTSEMFYQTLVESLPQNILRKDTKGRFVFANQKFCASLGRTVEEVLGKTDWDFFPPHLADKYHRDDLRVMATRQAIDTVEANQTPGGERIFVHVIKTPLYDSEGNVVGIQGIFWDVTERKKTEEALAYERDLLRALLENIPDRIYFKDVQSRFLRVSSSMSVRLGVSDPRDVLGKTDFDFYPAELAREFFADEQRIVLTGQPLINKLERIVDRDGKESWASVTKVPLRNKDGATVGIIGISRDVTKLKEAEVALERARDSALETARVKSQFLANMSHEIRTPMNAIVGMTELLFDTNLSDEQREFLKTIHGSTETLLSIISDILDYSKLDAGKLTIETIDFDLREVVESTAEMLAQRAQSKGIELNYEIDSDVPTKLRGDPGRVGQVLANLISNAVKFTERGDVTLRVSRVGGPASGSDSGEVVVRIAVSDTGIGIGEAAQARIFQAFTQGDGSTSRKYGGTGLGLAISKQLVEAMRGQMGLLSKVGEGSTFWFELPFSAQQAQPAARDPGDIRGLRVLVVDDHSTSRDILAEQLRRWDLRADAAGDAAQALSLLREGAAANDPYTFAVIDMQMPGTDGLTLARGIKDDAAVAATRVVVLTPLGNRLDAELMDTHGINATVAKPVRQSRLFDALVNSMQARPTTPSAAPFTPLTVCSTARILVAEDNLVNQRLALRQLHKLGYHAQPVTNGHEVLQELHRQTYDVILMDCQMPELDGYEVTKRIRDLEKETHRAPAYIIAVTAHALEGDRERCMTAGMNDYITKPVHIAQLEAALHRALRRREPGPVSDTAGVIDPVTLAALKQLREPGLSDPLAELFGLFQRESVGLLERVERGATENNSTAVAQAAHTLKGSASNLGATHLAVICLAMEQRARASDWPAVQEQLPQLREELERVKRALDAELKAS